MQRHRHLAVTGLAQRPGILALDARRALAVLDDARVIQHPRLRLNPRAHTLGDRAINDRHVPRAVGEKVLQRLVLNLSAAQPRDHRLKRLALARGDQTTRVQHRVGALLRTHQPRSNIGEIRCQALHDLRRSPDHGIIDLGLNGDSGNHDRPIRTRFT